MLRFDAQMQAQLIARLLSARLTRDGRPQCITAVQGDYNTTASCTGGSPSADSERVVLSFEYIHVGDVRAGPDSVCSPRRGPLLAVPSFFRPKCFLCRSTSDAFRRRQKSSGDWSPRDSTSWLRSKSIATSSLKSVVSTYAHMGLFRFIPFPTLCSQANQLRSLHALVDSAGFRRLLDGRHRRRFRVLWLRPPPAPAYPRPRDAPAKP